MSSLKSAIESPTTAIPFKVRLEPYLIDSICELSRLVRDKGNQNSDVSGLLFGRFEAGTRTVEALKTFLDVGTHSELARRARWDKAYKSTLEESKNDSELSELDLVGWFSFRTGSGLLSSDVVFHNQNFRKAEDLALIIWREGPSQVTAEVYSKSDSDALTADDYRWGSVRLSADIRHMREAVDLAMRAKLSDDSYLRTYDTGEQPSQLESLRRKAEAASERLLGFLYRRKEEPTGEPIRGYIGDGRLPGRSQLGLDSELVSPTSQSYFNPYSDLAMGRMASDARADASSAPPVATSWPGTSGSAFATAPARIPEPRPDYRPTEARLRALPPAATGLDFANIGRAPRTGRATHKEVSGLPMVLRSASAKKKSSWQWPLGIFVVCSGLVFAFLTMGGLQSDGGRIGQILQSVFPGGELNLKVHNEDDRLRLTWNQKNHTVVTATDATLQIFDGQQHRDIHLDGRQVSDGSVLYRPLTSDVTFRLEVRGEQGATSGSVRVLDGMAGRQPVLDVSAPGASDSLQTAQAPSMNDTGVPLGSVTAVKDASAPALIRDGVTDQPSAAAALSATPSPVTETPFVSASNIVAHRAVVKKPRAQHYETPLTIGTLGATGGGTTINGWDTSTERSRSKQRGNATVAPTLPKAVAAMPIANTGYVPPRPLMQVMPNTRAIPTGAIQARTRVEVQVDVDQAGHVSTAHVVSTGVNDKVSGAALAAARQWTFDPASNNGQRVVSEHTIVFEFRPEQR